MLSKKRKIQKLLEELDELAENYKNDSGLKSLDNHWEEARNLYNNFFRTLDSLTKEQSSMLEGQFESEVKKLSDRFINDLDLFQEKYKEQFDRLNAYHERRLVITKELEVLLGKK